MVKKNDSDMLMRAFFTNFNASLSDGLTRSPLDSDFIASWQKVAVVINIIVSNNGKECLFETSYRAYYVIPLACAAWQWQSTA